MDRYVVGHDDVKEAILLGLIAREHIYLEGPPGTAKTMLAEITSEAAELEFYFYQLHRDTRLAELVGDTIIFRERDTSGGEIIRQMNRKGGILTAEICVLDDISRAPGEALNVLVTRPQRTQVWRGAYSTADRHCHRQPDQGRQLLQ